jgi:Fe2+ transport system protein FeoA
VLQVANTAPGTVSLAALDTGATARLHTVATDPEACSLLRALGLTEGSVLRVCQQGDPCIILVRSTRIGISNRVAQQVVVVPQGRQSSEAPGR